MLFTHVQGYWYLWLTRPEKVYIEGGKRMEAVRHRRYELGMFTMNFWLGCDVLKRRQVEMGTGRSVEMQLTGLLDCE